MKSLTTLWISNAIFQGMLVDADRWAPYETGGVFMGYRAKNDDVVVTHLIAAGPNASHKRTGLYPDQDYQLKQIADIYSDSKGTITYLGDWHTHPNSKPTPSFKDKRTLTKIALTPESKNLRPIMVILGTKPQGWILNAIQYVSGSMWPWPFSKCIYDNIPCQSYDD